MCKKFLITIICLLFFNLSAQSQNKYSVEIVRDSFGVPHIFGKTDADCSYGLVYCAMEDDYKTVLWGLLLARGKLGLLMGAEGAKIEYRVWNPFRSKLAAAILGGVENIWMVRKRLWLRRGD
jgi:acyl-homoserine lactone acylase PvdQ